MNCPECGTLLDREAQFCPKCYARIEPPGLWRRFLSWWQRAARPPRSFITINKSVEIKTTDKDGQRHEYHSLEEAPPELRAKIEELEVDAAKEAFSASSSDGLTSKFIAKKTISVIKVKDASGTERTYHSLGELPPAIRAAFDKAQKQLEQDNSPDD